jgi:hypothetical protein
MRSLVGIVVILSSLAVVRAAVPPDRINYQGVLRDAAGAPRNGAFDMAFHLYDQATAGNEILVDRHLTANAQAVVVTDGLFNVELGSGQMLDGSGPGTYATLGSAFSAQAALWLEVEIGGEILSPRLHLASSGYALNAGALNGLPASNYLDTSATPQSKLGRLTVDGTALPGGNVALTATGAIAGRFTSPLNASYTFLAYLGYGITAQGSTAGGYFFDSDSNSVATIAGGNNGIEASGGIAGGVFANLGGTGSASLALASEGITAAGAARAGNFQNTWGTSSATLADGYFGLRATGTVTPAIFSSAAAGYFEGRDANGALISTAEIAGVGRGSNGSAYGFGATFRDELTGNYGSAGDSSAGIGGVGSRLGGSFYASNTSSTAFAAWEDDGIFAYGNRAGGSFADLNSSADAKVGYDTYKIQGTGSVAFVQNHPTQKDRVIVYNAPEGAEVATYARGSARLRGGEARIPLDETFAWVTNPDLGLTAFVTPVGEWADLYVASKSTHELVVRSRDPESSEITFDYLVYGLRIGFEETSIVQKKEQESYLPSMAEHRKRYRDLPELRRFNALERFKAMRSGNGLEATPDLSASSALVNAIHEFDPKLDALPDSVRRAESWRRHRPEALPGAWADSVAGTPREAEPIGSPQGLPVAATGCEEPGSGGLQVSGAAAIPAETLRVSEAVSAGELLAIDPAQPDRVRRAEGIADPRFVGVAASDSVGDEVTLATSRIVRVQADAAFGAIAPGDPLTTSPTPGLAMRAIDPAPGGVFGKALDALDSGLGEIRALWMPH